MCRVDFSDRRNRWKMISGNVGTLPSALLSEFDDVVQEHVTDLLTDHKLIYASY